MISMYRHVIAFIITIILYRQWFKRLTGKHNSTKNSAGDNNENEKI